MVLLTRKKIAGRLAAWAALGLPLLATATAVTAVTALSTNTW